MGRGCGSGRHTGEERVKISKLIKVYFSRLRSSLMPLSSKDYTIMPSL